MIVWSLPSQILWNDFAENLCYDARKIRFILQGFFFVAYATLFTSFTPISVDNLDFLRREEWLRLVVQIYMLPLALFLSYLISSALVLPQPIAQINSQNIMYFLQENKISENKINSKMGKFRKISSFTQKPKYYMFEKMMINGFNNHEYINNITHTSSPWRDYCLSPSS